MTADTFDDRVARLEEHIVAPPRATVEELLDQSERALARGDEETALARLRSAKIRQDLENIRATLDRMEGRGVNEVDDDA
jgi:hypothetical protein